MNRTGARPETRRRLEEGAGETGAVTIVLVGIIAMLLVLTGAIAVAARVFIASEQARAAADQAALAGATAWLSPGVGDEPCAVAARVARANDAHLTRCAVVGESVQVGVDVSGVGPWKPDALARAGSPSASTPEAS